MGRISIAPSADFSENVEKRTFQVSPVLPWRGVGNGKHFSRVHDLIVMLVLVYLSVCRYASEKDASELSV